jgi:hypothetical protein
MFDLQKIHKSELILSINRESLSTNKATHWQQKYSKIKIIVIFYM